MANAQVKTSPKKKQGFQGRRFTPRYSVQGWYRGASDYHIALHRYCSLY